LGVVHQGNHRSFTLDIADLYKHRVSIPAAFEAVAMSGGMSVPASVIREAMRDKLFRTSFFQNAVSDIVSVFSPDSSAPDVELEDANTWWDGS
jgi:CRISPR-associated protein Cas1